MPQKARERGSRETAEQQRAHEHEVFGDFFELLHGVDVGGAEISLHEKQIGLQLGEAPAGEVLQFFTGETQTGRT